ncbi:MAG: hypothetical protein KBT02_10185 [Treponema sp.]|nr:hypothetical protein [Candidatus Treponema caballi]
MPRKFGDRTVFVETGEVLDPRTTPEFYTMETLRNAQIWTPEMIRKEYSRLRKIANKRVEALGRSEFRTSETYRRNVGKYKPLAELTLGETRALLYDASRMISASTGGVRGLRKQRAEAINTLQSHGYDFINRTNYQAFGQFMEEWRSNADLRGFGSTEAVALFNAAAAKKIPPDQLKEDFIYWLENEEQLAAAPKIRHAKGEEVSADEYRALIEELKQGKQKKGRKRK